MPILEAIYSAEEQNNEGLNVGAVAELTGFPFDVTLRGVRALAESGYVIGHDNSTSVGWDLYGIRLLERGRRAIGQWPTEDVYETLVLMLQTQISNETDPERRSRLQKLLATVTDVGKDVAGSVLAAWFRQMTGLS